jgi:hypothetical protein
VLELQKLGSQSRNRSRRKQRQIDMHCIIVQTCILSYIIEAGYTRLVLPRPVDSVVRLMAHSPHRGCAFRAIHIHQPSSYYPTYILSRDITSIMAEQLVSLEI